MNTDEIQQHYIARKKMHFEERIKKSAEVIANGILMYSLEQRYEWNKIKGLATAIYEKNTDSSFYKLVATEGCWPLEVTVEHDPATYGIEPTLSVELSTGRIVKGLYVYTVDIKIADILSLATKLHKLDTHKIIADLERLTK